MRPRANMSVAPRCAACLLMAVVLFTAVLKANHDHDEHGGHDGHGEAQCMLCIQADTGDSPLAKTLILAGFDCLSVNGLSRVPRFAEQQTPRPYSARASP